MPIIKKLQVQNVNCDIGVKVENVEGINPESWTFVLDDNSIVSRTVYINNSNGIALDTLVFTLDDGSTVTKAVYAG